MESATYNEIYRSLNNADDIEKISCNFNLPASVLSVILTQKLVRQTKATFYKIKNQSENITELWESGESLVDISKKLNFPPVLTASILLKHKGISRNGFKRITKDLSKIKDARLKKAMEEAIEKDFIYSPWAHESQCKRAGIGEAVLREWLSSKNISFITEKEALRKGNTETPDFIINGTLSVDGKEVRWIDSKAHFGDVAEHKHIMEKQFSRYLEIFGGGMVVYWYGFVESVPEIEPRIVVKDRTYFTGFEEQINRLFEYGI